MPTNSASPLPGAAPGRRPPGRPRHDHPARMDGLSGTASALFGDAFSPGPQHAEAPAVHLVTRHRLEDDAVCAVEAIMPSALARNGALARHGALARNGAPAASLLDRNGRYLRQIGGLGTQWSGGPIAVAVASADLLEGRLIGLVTAALLGSGLPAEQLNLILPEQALLDIDTDAVLGLAALRDLGIGLCVDNYGAGVASLTLLRRLPLTGIKLARSLVRGLPYDREDAAITRAIISTAHALDLAVVADGIDTERQRAFLAHCGCDEGQGALFGAPLAIPAYPHDA